MATDSTVPSFTEAARLWAKIGLLSFGGPAGQIALMHRELVEDRQWIGEQRFLHALNYCMLLPGPEAQQLATYIGWLMHRTKGGLVAGILFVLPGAIVMLALSMIYAVYRNVPVIDAVFFGVKAAVLAVVIEAVLRIGKRTLKNRTMVAIAALAFLGIFIFHVPFPLLILAAGIVGWIGSRVAPDRFSAARHGSKGPDSRGIIDAMFERGQLDHTIPRPGHIGRILTIWLPLWLGPVALLWLLAGHDSIWTQIGSFFSAMAVVTFGGAYAVLAYVAQAAVENFAWLKPGEMVDGLGLAETTPGPLIMVLQFVGFLAASRASGSLDPLLAGTLGAILTTWVTFAPCFLWIFLGAPYVEALRGNKAISGALSAISAAVVGVVLNLAIWFGLHVIFREIVPINFGPISLDLPILSSINWAAAFLAACTMVAMLRFKVGMIPTLAASAVAGVVLAQVM